MKRSNRLNWIGAIAYGRATLNALGVMVLLSFFTAPTSSNINSGSTYNRAPDGYGAWYAYMEKQKTGIKRWQKPFSDLNTEKRPITLLQINSRLSDSGLYDDEKQWVEKGNNLVVLGIGAASTAADFTTMQKSPRGDVKQVKSKKIKVKRNPQK